MRQMHYSEYEIDGDGDGNKLGFISLVFDMETVLLRYQFCRIIKSSRCKWIFNDEKIR